MRSGASWKGTTLAVCALILVALPAAAAAQAPTPPDPVYQQTLDDCVTGDNQFYSGADEKYAWYTNQAGCDSHANDRYERPTSQAHSTNTISHKPTANGLGHAYPLAGNQPRSPVFLSGLVPDGEFGEGASVFSTEGNLYHEYLDITRGQAGYLDVSQSEGWLFFQTELFGEAEVGSDLERVSKFAEGTYYTVRLANNASANDARGGIALRNQRSMNITPVWSGAGALVFEDNNHDVSGANGVNTPKPGDPASTGYEDGAFTGYLWVRKVITTFNGVSRPAVEFAFNYKAYNAARNRNLLPSNLTYIEFDATRGLKDEENYLWNDEYTLFEAGSPNPGEANGTGTQNVSELDSLRFGAFTPQLTISKTPDSQTVNAGDGIAFDIEVQNTGVITATGVTLEDQLPPGPAWSENDPDCAIDGGGKLTCSFGDLAPGQKRSVSVTAATSLQECGQYDNTATVMATNHGPVSDSGQIRCLKPSINIFKTADKDIVHAGDPIGFTIEIVNSGAGDARAVTVVDELPPGVTWSDDSADCLVEDASVPPGQVLVCDFGTIAAGTERTVRVTAVTSFAACGVYDNTVQVFIDTDVAGSASDSITCLKPQLEIVKDPEDQLVDAGDTIQFTIRVENKGPGIARSVTLDDPLPSGVTWSESDPSCEIAAGRLACDWGDLAAGDRRSVSVTALTSASRCGIYDNTATVSATNHPPVPDSGRITCQEAMLNVVKTPDGTTVNAGDPIAFDVVVTSIGPGTARDVTLSDPLPAGPVWTVGTPTAGTCAINAGVLNCTGIGDLPQGATWSVTVSSTTSHAECKQYDNTATASAANTGPASDTGMILCLKPAVTLAKSTSDSTIVAGEDARFSITVTNAGPGTARDVVVTDVLPAGLDWVADGALPAGCAIAANALSCSFATLAPSSITVNFKATTSADKCGAFPNTVTATGSNTGTIAPASATVTCTVPDQVPNQGAVLNERISSSPSRSPAAARLAGVRRCERGSTVSISGRQIRKVVFSVNGKRVKTLNRANAGGDWRLRVRPRALRAGHQRVVARVTFSRASGARSQTLGYVLAACARSAILPTFTG